jgi:hypothetical protein
MSVYIMSLFSLGRQNLQAMNHRHVREELDGITGVFDRVRAAAIDKQRRSESSRLISELRLCTVDLRHRGHEQRRLGRFLGKVLVSVCIGCC